MPNFIDLKGKTYNQLTAQYRVDRPGTYWHCVCTCGGTKEVAAGNLKNGNVKSCGCLGILNQMRPKNRGPRIHLKGSLNRK